MRRHRHRAGRREDEPAGIAQGADAKPDPGDANDHSNPQHDAKSKKSGD